MGGIFLRRAKRPKSEILNDINGEIVNTFRIARDHPDALAAQFDLCLASREIFGRLLATPPESLTDIRRAARGFIFSGFPSAASLRIWHRRAVSGRPHDGPRSFRGRAQSG